MVTTLTYHKRQAILHRVHLLFHRRDALHVKMPPRPVESSDLLLSVLLWWSVMEKILMIYQ